MKQTESLRKNQDFQRVYKKGKSCADRYLVMYVLPNEMEINRLGVSVSRKVGNSVVRHKMKRRIKEYYRGKEDQFRCGFDIVVIVRKGAVGKTYKEIGGAIMHLAHLHNLIDKKTGESQ